jgi:hypothetical protein
MKTKPKNYYEWTIGTKATHEDKAVNPHRTVEWRFVSPNYKRVGIGHGKFIVFAGDINLATVDEFKDYADKTFGESESVPKITKSKAPKTEPVETKKD